MPIEEIKCGSHSEITKVLGVLTSDISHIKGASESHGKKLEKLIEDNLNNRNLIDQLSKDMKNGLSTKVNKIEENLFELTDCLKKERIERKASFEGWVGRSFHKALNNLGVIIAVVLLWKLITWISNCPETLQIIKKMIGF